MIFDSFFFLDVEVLLIIINLRNIGVIINLPAVSSRSVCDIIRTFERLTSLPYCPCILVHDVVR